MRHLSLIIKSIKNIQVSKPLLSNNEYKKILESYRGLDYRELIANIKLSKDNSILLYENNDILLKYNVHKRFSPREYNSGYLRVLEGNISLENNNENLNYNDFMKPGQVQLLENSTIFNNPTSSFAHTLSIEPISNIPLLFK